ncbi:hypothetical protein G5I_09326 [Acromyrmex echinatior]|uniref:Uncharacterized protein n=1 Tax=Acromyrmex echinatior TaxID=103372 RepID=F4WTX3_ACREC|nr:hypothetical protein G5I_09326 [Acromyrmex echinatior]
MEEKRGSKKVGNWATFTPADPVDLSKRRPLNSRQVKEPGGKMLVHVYSALLFWWIPEDPDPLERRPFLSPTDQASFCWSPFPLLADSARRFAGIDDLPSCEPKEYTLEETERRTVATGRPARCSITTAGRSVTSAGSTGIASGALADLIELSHLDGLPDAFKIDAYNAGLIAGHAFLLQKDLTDLFEQRAVHGSAFASLVASGYLGVATTAAEASTEGATTAKGETTTAAATGRSAVAVTGGHRRLRQGEPCQTDNHTLSLERKLAVISKCLRSRDNNHVTLDSVNDASSRGKEDPLTPAQFLAFLRVEAIILEKSCDMPTRRNNLLSVRLFCKDEIERWTAQSSGRTVGSWSQKESLRHQEEKEIIFFSETDDMNDRSTDGFSHHRYRRLRGLSPIHASCP